MLGSFVEVFKALAQVRVQLLLHLSFVLQMTLDKGFFALFPEGKSAGCCISAWYLLGFGAFSREALYVGKASVDRTHCPGVAARLTEQCLYRPGLKDANNTRYRLLRRRFLSIGCLSHDFSNIRSGRIGDIDGSSDGQCEGCGGVTSAAPQRGQCQGPVSSSTAVELETAKEATMGKCLGLICCQRSSFQPVPGQAGSVSRCAGGQVKFSGGTGSGAWHPMTTSWVPFCGVPYHRLWNMWR